MSFSKENFNSRVLAAIDEGDSVYLKKLVDVAKLLNANNELKMLHEAIGTSDGGLTHIRYQNKSFPTIKSLAKYLSVSPKVLAERLKRGLPEEEWGKTSKSLPITYLGKEFKSIADLAKTLNLNRAVLYKRISDGWPEDRWGESSLKHDRDSRIITRYKEGDSIKQLAISFGLKMDFIRDLLERRGELKPVDKMYVVKFNPRRKKQLNLRLNIDYQEKIEKIRNYWSKKGKFKFLESSLSDLSTLNSDSTLAKFILEKSLDNLSLELENELNIDRFIEKICELRIEDKKLHKQWQKVKLKNYENGIFKNLLSNELIEYEKTIEQIGENLIKQDLEKETPETDLILQKKFWKIAIKKSYLIPDRKSERISENIIQQKMLDLLKKNYPDII